MEDFKLKMPLAIRFADFDSLGHVNNSHFLTYFEIARIKYFEEIISGGNVDWYNEGIIVAKAVIDFKNPLDGYNDYFVSIRCSRVGNKSFDFSYLITKEENEEVLVIAEGMTVMVCFNFKLNKTIVMKDEWRKAIHQFEKVRLDGR